MLPQFFLDTGCRGLTFFGQGRHGGIPTGGMLVEWARLAVFLFFSRIFMFNGQGVSIVP